MLQHDIVNYYYTSTTTTSTSTNTTIECRISVESILYTILKQEYIVYRSGGAVTATTSY